MTLANDALDRVVKLIFWVSFCVFFVGPLAFIGLSFLVAPFLFEVGEVETMPEAHLWFDEHHDDLIGLRDLVLELPEIMRFDPPADLSLAPGHEAFVPTNKEKYELALAKCNELGVVNIQIWHDRRTGTLREAKFVLYSYGLTFGALSISVVFVPDLQDAADFFDDPWESYEPLGESGWYVVESDTRKGLGKVGDSDAGQMS